MPKLNKVIRFARSITYIERAQNKHMNYITLEGLEAYDRIIKDYVEKEKIKITIIRENIKKRRENGAFKIFKNNVSLHFYNNYKTFDGITKFYVLPTIEIFLDKTFDDDQEFAIKFEWLFWSFEISKYWGSIYEN